MLQIIQSEAASGWGMMKAIKWFFSNEYVFHLQAPTDAQS